MRIWYAIATHLKDHAVVTWVADDYGDRGSLMKRYLNAGHPQDSNVIPVIWATFWMMRVGLGVLKETLALGILFFDMISEGRFVNIHSVVGHNDSWHINLLAQMIVLITCCNGLTGDLIFGR